MKHFFNLFLRTIWKNRVFSFLNIAGLAVGMASFIIIVLWVSDELSYDLHNENADRIVRVVSHFKIQGQDEMSACYCPAPLANAVRNDYPEVENVVRFFRPNEFFLVQRDDKVFNESRVVFADSTIFNVFTIPLIKGDPDKVLASPRSITISESMARKYFGNEEAVGKLLRLNNNIDMEVTGIYEDMPSSSHFYFDFIGSIYTYSDANMQMWLSNNFTTYILLYPGTDIEVFEKKMSSLVDKYISVQAEQALGLSWQEIRESGTDIAYSVQKLTDIHLRSNHDGEFEAPGNIATVRIFTIIALFIIIIACINFTNLSTARSATRLLEVGVRKTFGVAKRQLMWQFIAESVIIVFIAHIIALILVEIFLPYFNELTSKDLGISYLSVRYVLSILTLIIVTGLLAGSYPAFYLSSFRPVTVLRGKVISRTSRFSIRSILVVVQFFISLVLLSSTIILGKQMRFMLKEDLGYDKEEVVVINNAYLLGEKASTFREKVLKNPEVLKASLSGYLPVPSNRNNSSVFPDGIITEDLFNCQNWIVDHNYLETWGLELTMGRNFSFDYPGDSLALILNEEAVRLLGWDEPLGRVIGIPGSYEQIRNLQPNNYTVIGVVKDFHFESMRSTIEPMVIYLGRSISRLSIRISENTDIGSLLKDLEKQWKEFLPDQPFSYTFVDQRLAMEYETEQKLAGILGLFTLLAFFVSSLGLTGLSIFTAGQRRREIGLRKVNGSGIAQIIWLLSKDFLKLVAVSFMFSVPVTIIIMRKWLEGFAYKTGISCWIFLLTLVATCLVAMISIISQSYRAATANPVDTFRTE